MSSSNACASPSPFPAVTKLHVDSVTFVPSVKSPASSNPLFLGGAGVRGLDIQGKFVIFTVIGVYLEGNAVPSLSVKWKGKTTEELTESIPFFREIVTGAFEKFIKVTMKLPLTGQQYSEKVTENCVAIWKQLGLYTDCEAKAVEKFLEIFKEETFPPGSSILFALSPTGSLTVAFSKDDSIPETGIAVIENKLLAEAVLESIIGKNGVSPGTRLSVAERLSQLMMKNKDEKEVSDHSVEEKLAKEN
ncbi:chalcone isomerase [Arabidopsis thaliana]|jgi:chalcone isomerase|uniref:Chalcone--flavanone isomerase 1 n=5 Tax=Arabidopsis TaxID=3701 RepID=CFI1_ARATH|nr:Chalcone-flavanone isomerase family protein [Arabidopsis thaliana]P41088.2 RecName: Full=Chalcone--flavanone isomerase 1; Short=Chalcone isomerase 1; AltName: Full=Protein TRANSPARENT TESTA 5 [Arabidopsis thaliana]4DOI_A Chain A, Chalcone--flavonone isomerase 1 [Arabidopsis thaliana]4DOI_B Chain B, Chalcone--flavonone isomerase 1 [Arabidopsis thaliana]AGA15816.1 CHI1 [Expression vector pUDE065]AKG06602.1 chalcone isomerase [synthetic construct]AXN70060.1 chalcone isomerase [Cloning vector |eukprot:NP_191072.1 Chalcone-flavanone isomerase family protein [Arabidopsis thaliana]